jgi:hypothetical protein
MPAVPISRVRVAHAACLAGAALGLTTIVAGLLWSKFVTPRQVWSTEKAQEYNAASDAWHAALTGSGDAGPDGRVVVDEVALAAARARFTRIQSELDSARFSKNRVGNLLVWTGLAVAGAFGVGYLIVRGDQN